MRKQKGSLINKATSPSTTQKQPDADLDLALKAREANLLGENGLLHAQDQYLAKAKTGSLVLPLDRLSQETRARLEQTIGPVEGSAIGYGGELKVSEVHIDGLGLAEQSDIEALMILGRYIHGQSHYGSLPFSPSRFRTHIEQHLGNPDSHRIVTHKQNGQLQAALFAHLEKSPLVDGQHVSCDIFYIHPKENQASLTETMLRALIVWAQTMDAWEIHFSSLNQGRHTSLSQYFAAQEIIQVGRSYKIYTK